MNVTIIEKKYTDVKGLSLILLYFEKKVSKFTHSCLEK